MNLKVGNRLTCKKCFINDINDGIINNLVVGNDYYITNYNGFGDLWVSENMGFAFTWQDFLITKNTIFDYFYTDKELRRLKLEKLG